MSDNNKRIAKNTAFLYIRMLFVLFVSLYTSRVVLNTLGVEDFGVYNVVAGFVTLFGFLMQHCLQVCRDFTITKVLMIKLMVIIEFILQD